MAAGLELRRGRTRTAGEHSRSPARPQAGERAPVWSFGRFVWHDVVTPDLERTKTYYNRLLGWKYRDLETGPGRYPTILCGGIPQGGLLTTAQLGMSEDGARILGYVSVPDVDAAAASAREHGGEILGEPVDLPALGRLVVLGDNAGAVFALLTSRVGDAPPPRRQRPGLFHWAELATPAAPQIARIFYQRVLGWQPDPDDAPTGEAGGFSAEATPQRPAGPTASWRRASPSQPPGWTMAVLVEHLPSARSRAARLGGTVLADALPIGHAGTMAVIRDNVGITIGLVDPRR